LTLGKRLASENLAAKGLYEVRGPGITGAGRTGFQGRKPRIEPCLDGLGGGSKALLDLAQTTPTTRRQPTAALEVRLEGLHKLAFPAHNARVGENGVKDGLDATGHEDLLATLTV
jgi:hypothetical protein